MSQANPITVGEVGEDCSVDRLSTTVTHTPVVASTMLADHTTLHVGGPAGELVVCTSEDDLVTTVRVADAAGTPLLVLSGGSNLVVGDAGFPGIVVKVATRGIEADVSSCGGALVTVAAGENWDDFVRFAVEQEWVGVEALSGIPGLVGSTPIQNVGAYGSEVSHTIARVRTLDRTTGQFATFMASDCGFGYRWSRFKADPGRYVVLQVVFQFELGTLSGPVRYPELATALDVELGERAPIDQVREAVLAIRAGKGMVLDEDDHDTWSAGSFFTNPVLPAERADALPAEAPRYPMPDGRTKTSAAWLIEHAGYAKGYARGPASISTKHSLALTNRGGATTEELLSLAREVRDGVERAFGVLLEPEPVLVNCGL